MNQNFEKLLSSVSTDISGKWISVGNVKHLLVETIEQCCDCIRAVDAYDIKDHFGIKEI